MLIYILLKKLWENIPPHVNMCITGAICVAHRDHQDLLRWCFQERDRGTADCQGQSPAVSCPTPWPPAAGWQGPYSRLGLGEELACWLDTRRPAEPGSPLLPRADQGP